MDRLKKLFELHRHFYISKKKSSLSEANPEKHKENAKLSWFPLLEYVMLVLYYNGFASVRCLGEKQD